VKLIAGEIRLDGEPAEDDVGGSVAGHIAARYICKIYLSTRFFGNGGNGGTVATGKKRHAVWPAVCRSS
jgi:hypothetical protein